MSTEMLAIFLLLSLYAGVYGQDCGFLLRQDLSNNPPPPSGWHMCYIDSRDVFLYDFPCRDLLQGLAVYNSADALLAAGGNFGCWNLVEYPDPDNLNACRDNVQHNIMVADCLRCTSMAVCIRYPKVEEEARHVELV